jgi:biofilm PGA synthesis lipoprotein PgaB
MNQCKHLLSLVFLFLLMTAAPVWADGALERDEGLFLPRMPSPGVAGPSKGLGSGTMVAAQVSLFYSQTLDEVDKRIAQLAEAGVNTLILRVFQNPGDRPYRFAAVRSPSGVYFRTQYAPVVDDVLGPVGRIARGRGLRVFAWMTTRHANYGFEDDDALRAIMYDFEKGTMVPARGFNLFRPDVVTRLEGLYADLARYPIDGILIQDDLILRHNEPFSPEAKQLFYEDHGLTADPAFFYSEISRGDEGRLVVSRYTDRFWVWTRWKNQKLLGLAKRLIDAAKGIKPDLQFAVNFYYESVLDPEKGMAWFSQSLETARDFPFDYFSIMAYHRQMKEELNLTLDETFDLLPQLTERAVEMARDPARVLMKIQVVDWKDSRLLPREETERVLRSVGKKPGVHIALVPYQPDLPAKTLIRSFTTHQIEAGRARGVDKSTTMYGPRPTFFLK